MMQVPNSHEVAAMSGVMRTHKGIKYVVTVAHPAADSYPWMPEDELQDLADHIAKNGQHDDIELLPDGRILDGRNRELACRVAGIVPRYLAREDSLTEDEIYARVNGKNDKRRHLTISQRAMVAAEQVTARRGDNQHKNKGKEDTPRGVSSVSQAAAADQLDVSHRTVNRAVKVKDKAPELAPAVKDGRLDIHTAAQVADLPAKQRKKVADSPTPKATAKQILAALPPDADVEDAEPEATNDPGAIDLSQYDLFATFDSIIEADDDAEESEPQPRQPETPKKRLPKHFKPGNQLDPNHPFVTVLRALSTVSATITKAIASDESGRLKAYLTHVQIAKVAQPPLVHHRALIIEGKHYDAQFIGLRALRRLVFLAGKGAKPLTQQQVLKAFEKASTDDTEAKAA